MAWRVRLGHPLPHAQDFLIMFTISTATIPYYTTLPGRRPNESNKFYFCMPLLLYPHSFRTCTYYRCRLIGMSL